MAKGDMRYDRSNRGGWGSSSNHYDDEGRGYSQRLFENFEAGFNLHGCQWLSELSTAQLYELRRHTTSRYGLEDLCEHPTWGDGGDGRIRRLIEKQCGKNSWLQFLARLNESYEDQRWLGQLESAILGKIRDQRWEAQRQASEAARLVRIAEESTQWRKEAQLTAGLLHSDFYEAFTAKEAYGEPEGEWLDDPLDAYQTGFGWGEEVRERQGIKLQVTLSLDISNSMYFNGIHEAAVQAFRELHLALEELKAEFPTSFYTSSFIFSGNRLNDRNEWEMGRKAYRLKGREWNEYNSIPQEHWLGEMENFRSVGYNFFEGEDTWIYTLLEELEKWENRESDPGCMRLDLIISDAVLEHPYDIRWSDKIQDRRDGALQTVILNLMPEEHWHNGALPRRFTQWAANTDNLAGMLRLVIQEFVSVYL